MASWCIIAKKPDSRFRFVGRNVCSSSWINTQETIHPIYSRLSPPGIDETRQYQNKIHLINHHLKKLGQQLGLSSKLTIYVARHSWASIAKSQNVPIAAISEAMGHTSERTTLIYLNYLRTHSSKAPTKRS
ncbi:MAG: tyrosine-type recombinase/integrase [Bacteroidales bacterium]|nr:tyrosine-type recombinase/integrase [Bacteroidales bacterium]